MNRIISITSMAIATAGCFVPPAVVSAKPERAPVRVESSVPANIKTGDEVTTTITLRALADIDRLEVSLAPFKGLELLSETKNVTFTNVKSGQGRDIVVTIRLTDPSFGSLAVTFSTWQGKDEDSGAKTVIFGSPKH